MHLKRSSKVNSSLFTLLFIPLFSFVFIACDESKSSKQNQTPLTEEEKNLGIERSIPKSLDSLYQKHFDRYTKVVAPNGKAIHIVAQNKLSTEQIIRSRHILEHYLKNYEGSEFGADKSAVANKMADNQAILCLLNGEDNGENPVSEQVTGQPLYQNEIQVEGHAWYMNQNYEHRDASFEEILHFVHDNGIGIDGEGGTEGVLPAYQAEIRAAQVHALKNKLWGLGSDAWIQELTQENSLTQEYLASLIDAYYGLWGAWTESSTHSMWGIYIAKTRAEIAEEDSMGVALLNKKFFHPYLTYMARIDASFNGIFSLKYDPQKPYTHHARYLKDVQLLGKNNNSVVVNEHDNHIIGNAGNNTVFFSGNQAEYSISTKDGKTIVLDQVEHRDGSNTLQAIEVLQFKDTSLDL